MPAEQSTRDAKLVQYLTEAYGKEKELETALQAHIAMAAKDTYRKRLQDHLKETKQHARLVERRIKALGGSMSASAPGPVPDAAAGAATTVTSAASKAIALAQGPLHAIRGTGEAEKQLKNVKTELASEYEEIGQYIAIEELATAVGDKETAKVAKAIRREEERMAGFLQKLIPTLTKQVVREEIPAKERNGSASRSRSASSRSSGRTASGSSNGSGSTRSTKNQAKRTATSAKRTAGSAKTTAKRAASTAKTAAKRTTGAAKPAAKRTTGAAKSTAKRATGSTKSTGKSNGRTTSKRATAASGRK